MTAGCAQSLEPVSTSDALESHSSSGGTPTISPIVDVSVLAARGHGNYREFASPDKLAHESSVALTGRIDGFEDGHTVVSSDERDRFAATRIRIDKIYKNDGVSFPDGFAYVSIARGIEVVARR